MLNQLNQLQINSSSAKGEMLSVSSRHNYPPRILYMMVIQEELETAEKLNYPSSKEGSF